MSCKPKLKGYPHSTHPHQCLIQVRACPNCGNPSTESPCRCMQASHLALVRRLPTWAGLWCAPPKLSPVRELLEANSSPAESYGSTGRLWGLGQLSGRPPQMSRVFRLGVKPLARPSKKQPKRVSLGSSQGMHQPYSRYSTELLLLKHDRFLSSGCAS